MKTSTKQTKVEAQTVVIFGDTIEKRKYELKEVIALTRARFEKDGLEVGKIAYYFLAFRHLKLVEISYETTAQIIKKIFELNGQATNTTAKCMAWYQARIKKGIVDIHSQFKPSTRIKQVVDISTLF